MAERARDVTAGARVSRDIGPPACAWLEEAAGLAGKMGRHREEPVASTIEPLGPVRRARWLVSLVGPSAAAWPLGAYDRGEGELIARAVELGGGAGTALLDPRRHLRPEFIGLAPSWDSGDAGDRVARLVRELAGSSPDVLALASAEDELAGGSVSPTLALSLAAALVRVGETGRAWAALSGVPGAEADALRAEVARRRGDAAEATSWAQRALTAEGRPRWRAQATLARLAWDAGDLSEAERLLEGARGCAAAEVHALIAWRRGAYEKGLRAIEHAQAESVDADARGRLEGARGLLEWCREARLEEPQPSSRSAGPSNSPHGQGPSSTKPPTSPARPWRPPRPVTSVAPWLVRPVRHCCGSAWAALLKRRGHGWLVRQPWPRLAPLTRPTKPRTKRTHVRWLRATCRPPHTRGGPKSRSVLLGDEQARLWAIESEARLRGMSLEDRARAEARLLVWAPGAVVKARVAAVDALVPSLTAPACAGSGGELARPRSSRVTPATTTAPSSEPLSR